MRGFVFIAVTLLATHRKVADAGPPPATFAALECAVAQFAYQLATTKTGGSAAANASVRDALNVDFLCSNTTTRSARFMPDLQREAGRLAHDRASAFARAVRADAPSAVFFVAPGGSDTGPGTQSQPFLTLQRAQSAAAATAGRTASSPAVVYLRGPHTYYLGDAPLALGPQDSNVTWAAFPSDPAGSVVLSGARLLTGLSWSPAPSPAFPKGVMQAAVSLPRDERRARWKEAASKMSSSSPSSSSSGVAGPPPLVASLFVNGARQIRARFPNANPQDGTGICFSATQRPGEGCPGWSACAVGFPGNFPAPGGTQISGITPNRGDSPTQGCDQCTTYGAFQYSIYAPPDGHPVYNQPLPGLGWQNNSLFSFWGSPFSRPAGITVDAVPGAGSCDGGHWATADYANATDAVVHMFHPGLWGGWMFALDNATRPAPSAAPAEFLPAPFTPAASSLASSLAAAIPSGMSLWLRADDLAVADGQPVSAWADASGAGPGRDAGQSSASLRPTYAKSCLASMPCVSFDGSQFLDNDAFELPAGSTIFAVMQDKGSTTSYGSGVFYSKSGDNGVGSRSADATASADDDPSPVGSTISALMVDWAGSPANPGHRDLSTRPAVIGVVYTPAATLGFVDGCLELSEAAGAGAGTGYMIGTRNDEMGRFLKGVVGEILVYPRQLNSTERSAVNTYLSGKWRTPTPKHCASPSSSVLALNFGYGGFQEARGGNVHPGQRFYVENVRSELDAPGEWFFADSGSAGEGQLLYFFPNGSSFDLSGAEVAVPLADSIITVKGTPSSYAANISIVGFVFTQSRVTFLEQYEVPSGGDWSVHRGAAVVVQDAEGISVVGNTFNQTGGNGVLFSNHVADSTVSDGEFVYTGDSGVVLVGSTVLADGSAPTYPDRNIVARNHIHEWGVYGKQTSCVALALSANTTIVDNVCYNGPRAGVNFNDGFGGGTYFARNVFFGAVRETGDHGPANSWNRQPYFTRSGVDDGFPASAKPAGCPDCSFIQAWDRTEQNLMLNGYNGVWSLDRDDGSQFIDDADSFLVWGGCKNYLGNSKRCEGHVILYPGVDGRSAGNRRCQTDDNGVFANQYHVNNTCVSADGDFYSFSNCHASNPNNLNSTCYATGSNTLLADAGSSFLQDCGQSLTFEEWQALGQDVGSTTGTTPPVDQLIAMGAKVLGISGVSVPV